MVLKGAQNGKTMLKILFSSLLVGASLVTITVTINRWKTGSSSFVVVILQTLCIGCVAAGLLALWLF